MIRNLKALGIALVAVFAMSAVAASAASAQNGVLTSDGPVTLTGSNNEAEGAGPNALTSETGEVKCPEVHYYGHKYNETPHELIPSGESTFTVTAEYTLCTGPLGLRTTVEMNSCDYDFHLGETVPDTVDTYYVNVTVTCDEEGDHIQLTVYSSKANHEAENPFCTQTVTADEETNYTGLTATDNTDGTIRLHGTVHSIPEDSSGSFPCPNKTGVEAELHLDVIVTGDDSVSEPTEISLSDE